MIKAVLIFNNQGKPRLIQWYQQMSVVKQQEQLQRIFQVCNERAAHQCNFLEPNNDTLGDDIRIIYRNFATLYFVMVVDSSESELGILDLIQVFVEALDRLFGNVCELDIVMNPVEVSNVLSEIVSGGLVFETSLFELMALNDVKKAESNSKK